MGKKKSKTSKQKAKTGRKLSKTFAKKLGISEGKPEDMVVDKNNGKSNAATAGNKKNKHPRRSRTPMKDSKTIAAQRKATPGSTEEKKDFESQHASMHERERFIDWKRNDIKSNSKNASSTLSTPLQFLQPATFCATDGEKSTSQLVQETLHQVSGLSGIGATSTFSNTQTQQGRQQSSLAMAAATSTSLAATERWTAEADSPDKSQRKNPWAVLGTGDDEDDDDADIHGATQRQITQPSPFQFAPPTFSFGDNNNSSNFAMADEIDPDL
jgi:hypothetical protein